MGSPLRGQSRGLLTQSPRPGTTVHPPPDVPRGSVPRSPARPGRRQGPRGVRVWAAWVLVPQDTGRTPGLRQPPQCTTRDFVDSCCWRTITVHRDAMYMPRNPWFFAGSEIMPMHYASQVCDLSDHIAHLPMAERALRELYLEGADLGMTARVLRDAAVLAQIHPYPVLNTEDHRGDRHPRRCWHDRGASLWSPRTVVGGSLRWVGETCIRHIAASDALGSLLVRIHCRLPICDLPEAPASSLSPLVVQASRSDSSQ